MLVKMVILAKERKQCSDPLHFLHEVKKYAPVLVATALVGFAAVSFVITGSWKTPSREIA